MPAPTISTYSITAFDPKSRSWAVAVQSRYFAVGSIVPWAEADVGALATQATGSPEHWIRARPLLKAGNDAPSVLHALLESDECPQSRQIGIIDSQGDVGVHTGIDCLENAGHRIGNHFSIQGNCLAPRVLDKMYAAYLATEDSTEDLAARLIQTLRVAQSAGGDRRGRQAASLLIVCPDNNREHTNRYSVNLRVDDHTEPLAKLENLMEFHRILYGWNREFHMRDLKDAHKEISHLLLQYNLSGEGKQTTEERLLALLKSFNLEDACDAKKEQVDARVIGTLCRRLEL
jgi:uncharacterized Ntn-hydrolase superfamily protein